VTLLLSRKDAYSIGVIENDAGGTTVRCGGASATASARERSRLVARGAPRRPRGRRAARRAGRVQRDGHVTLDRSGGPPGAHGAVLDVTGLDFVDSSAIRQLFGLVARLKERRQRVHVVSPAGSSVLRTLELVEFSRAASMHDTLDDAIAGLDDRSSN